MSEHPEQQRFYKYLDGELSPGAEQSFRDHLDGCDRCQQRLDQLREEEQQLSEALADSPAAGSVKDKVLDRIEVSESEQSSNVIGVFGSGTASRALQVAASLIVCLGVGSLVYIQLTPGQQMSETSIGEGQMAMQNAVHEPETTGRAEMESDEKRASQPADTTEPRMAKADESRDEMDSDQPQPVQEKEGSATTSRLAQTSATEKAPSKDDAAESKADDRLPSRGYDVRYRDARQLFHEVRRQFPSVEFHRDGNHIEYTAGDREDPGRVQAFFDRNDTTAPPPTSPDEHFRMAMKLEEFARDDNVSGQTAGGPARSQDRASRLRSEATEKKQTHYEIEQTSVDARWSREQLKEANEHLESVKQIPYASRQLTSRASIHITINHLRMRNHDEAVMEYEFWKDHYGDTDVLPPDDRKLLKRIENQTTTYDASNPSDT